MAVSNDKISFTVDGGEVRTIKRGEHARNFRYWHRNRHRWVSALTAVKELNSTEAHPRLSEMEAQYGPLLDRRDGPKRKQGKRPHFLYRMKPGVVVLTGSSDAT